MADIPQHITLSTSLLENSKLEPLQKIVDPYKGLIHIPADVGQGGPVTMVFIELQKCFQKAGYVAEGLLGNIIWGFSECGYDPKNTAAGLTALRKLGYIRYTDSLGNEIFEGTFDPSNGGKPIWIRYTTKMINLFVKEL